MSRQRGNHEDFDTSDVDQDLFEEGDANDVEYTDELRRRDAEFFESLLDPLPDEDDEEEEEE